MIKEILILVALLILGAITWIKLLSAIFNLAVLRNGECPKHRGIVFNKETQQIEEDESDILPFG